MSIGSPPGNFTKGNTGDLMQRATTAGFGQGKSCEPLSSHHHAACEQWERQWLVKQMESCASSRIYLEHVDTVVLDGKLNVLSPTNVQRRCQFAGVVTHGLDMFRLDAHGWQHT